MLPKEIIVKTNKKSPESEIRGDGFYITFQNSIYLNHLTERFKVGRITGLTPDNPVKVVT